MPHTAHSPRASAAVIPTRRSTRLQKSKAKKGAAATSSASSSDQDSRSSRSTSRKALRGISQTLDAPKDGDKRVADDAGDDEDSTMSESVPPSPERPLNLARKRSASEPPPTRQSLQPTKLAPRKSLFYALLPLLLALPLYYLYTSTLAPLWEDAQRSDIRIERALPIFIQHVKSTEALLTHAQDFQDPRLDHVSIREMRDAARYAGDQFASLRDLLDALCGGVMAAKMQALELGVRVYLSGRTTLRELSSPATLIPLASATRYLSSDALDLFVLSNITLHHLTTSYALGTNITASDSWRALTLALGTSERAKWLGFASGGAVETALGTSRRETEGCVRRTGVLARTVRDLREDVERMVENLKGVFAMDDPVHPPKPHNAVPGEKMENELRAALESLAVAVKRAEPDKG
ncbi:hypothetical protein EXIGLDRAFT_719248 [Exidia glandulosa HHB12029]|uniref:Uncharacterized protein n=1 Tax=Exidia glandulosa HHB12029 TaxID=1314781 RepID=A0A165H7H8_EXIGL|nr:hypothetical protein EXIGLDRAFT_719248 [Exidia glandulosa HHB12029]